MNVPSILIDTQRLVTSLKKRGFTEDQALGITDALREIDLSALATKGDIRELELRIINKLGALLGGGIVILAAMNYFGT